jgi:fatty acid desaturase
MRAFKVSWNLLVGIVTLSPSPFFTRHHRDHHSARLYGTPVDPEYVSNFCPWRGGLGACFFALEILLLPLAIFLRFLLAPLTWIHPRVREFILRRGSSLTLNWRYERRLTPQDRWAITAVETLCWIRATTIPLAVIVGWTAWTRLPLLYVLAVSVVALNQMRLLADHHLDSDGEPLDMHGHLLDSCNFTHPDWLTRLFFPFAIRYHALHHLFPALPYHNLAAAHACLLEQVSPQSPYRTLERSGWWSVARHAFRARPSSQSIAAS